MCPRQTVGNLIDRMMAYAERASNLAPRAFSRVCTSAYFKNLRGRQFRPTRTLAQSWMDGATIIGAIHATAIDHVMHVISCGTNAQMVWTYARWVIARVQNHQTAWNGSVHQFIREPMCSDNRPAAATDLEASIAEILFSSCPNPAVTSSINVVPKTCDDCFTRSNWPSHLPILSKEMA